MQELSEDEKEYQETLQKLEDYNFAQTITQSEEWSILRKALKIVLDETQAQYNAIDFSQPGAAIKAVQCQVALDCYGHFLETLIGKYKQIGEEAYESAKENGWLSRIVTHLKKDAG